MHRSATALQVLCYSVVLWNLWQGAYKIVCRFFWGKKKGVYLQPVTLGIGRGFDPVFFVGCYGADLQVLCLILRYRLGGFFEKSGSGYCWNQKEVYICHPKHNSRQGYLLRNVLGIVI